MASINSSRLDRSSCPAELSELRKPLFDTVVFESADQQPNDASADDVFNRLDGCDITAAGDRWHLEICGVIDEGASRWVQVGVDGPRHEWLTVRLSRGAGAEEVLLAVRSAVERAVRPGSADELQLQYLFRSRAVFECM